jgi:hypothetical protein
MIPIIAAMAVLALPGLSQPEPRSITRSVAGWTVMVNERLLAEQKAATDIALALLETQLKEIARVVPGPAVERLRMVRLWFSPEYADTPPRAEFHPDASWLTEHGRDPAMAKSVEFTNIRIFPAETRRMPNFALHELAHAYHHLILGDDNPEILSAYADAKAGGKYDRVERRDSEGRKRMDRAYALASPQEYFAESTEAYFSRNDFFPYNRSELEHHDPSMARLLAKLWNRRPPRNAIPPGSGWAD